MAQLIDLFKNDTFWALLGTLVLYLAGAWARPAIEKIPNSNVFFRLIRLLHLVLNKVDPGGNEAKDRAKNVTKLTAIALVLFASLFQTACAASFEEARLANATSTRKAATRDNNECQAIDRRHRVWGGIEYGSLAATGASGISTIPVASDAGKTALVVAAVVFTGAAAVSHFEDGEATARWASECSR